MVMRPYWSGQIRLSLISVPVNIYAAVNSARSIPMHEIYRKTGKRVKHQLIAGDKVIERDDVVKGYEYSKGHYVLLEPDEIKALKLPSKKTLEIVQFVSTKDIDPLYFEKPYFVAPANPKDDEAFVTIREGLRKTGTYGVGQLTIAGRERLVALKPCGRGMLLETIRYHDELRKSDAYFDEIGNSGGGKEAMDLIGQLIKKKTTEFKPEKFEDHYREALRELIEAKRDNREPDYEEDEVPNEKVVNLMDALKKSLRGDSKPANDNARKKKATAKKKPAAKKKKSVKAKSKKKAA